MQNDSRRTVNVVLVKDAKGTRILFENHPLSGELGLIWFPVQSELTVFQDIEQIMVLAGIAVNVANVKQLTQSWMVPDEFGRKLLEVTYNVPAVKKYVVTVRNRDIDHLTEDLRIASFRIESGNIIETLLKLDYTEHFNKTTYDLKKYYHKVSYSAFDGEIIIGDGIKEYMVVGWSC